MPDEFNSRVIAEFRTNRGHVGGVLAETPIVLVHHVGARSGAVRVTPLAYTERGDGQLLIAASNGGSATHPAWYHNLKAHPMITVQRGAETFTARAQEIEGAERAELWPQLLAASPALREFEANTARQIPLLALSRLDAAA